MKLETLVQHHQHDEDNTHTDRDIINEGEGVTHTDRDIINEGEGDTHTDRDIIIEGEVDTQQNIAMKDILVEDVVHHEYATIDDIVHITEQLLDICLYGCQD